MDTIGLGGAYRASHTGIEYIIAMYMAAIQGDFKN